MRRNSRSNDRRASQGRLYMLAATMVLVAARAMAQQQAVSAEPERRVVVSIPDRKLALIEDGQVVRLYPVAVGKRVSASPAGEFTIVNRLTNPGYYHQGKVIAPAAANNPLGSRWMGLSLKGYGIHGTNEPWSIGKAASHGCIRMAKADLEELFERVRVGDVVEIRAERDTTVAAIFGGEPTVIASAAGFAGQN